MTTPILEGIDISVSRNGALLVGVPALRVTGGEKFGIIGPNGAGKTTLLLTLAGLNSPFSGRLLFRASPVDGRKDLFSYRRRIAVVFQEPLLLAGTVFRNASLGLRLRGAPRNTVRSRAMECLELMRVVHLANRDVRSLSGGEARRVSLARALATDPEILFLDEPFSALDTAIKEEILGDIENIAALAGMTVIFTTHDRLEAIRLADRIAVMHDGRIVQTGTPEEIVERPVDAFTASFVGTETILRGRIILSDGGVAAISVGPLTMEAVTAVGAGHDVVLCIRPENVVIAVAPAAMASARNVFPGIVTDMAFQGTHYRVTIDCGVRIAAFVTRSSVDTMDIRKGSPVIASFKATAVHVLPHGSWG